MSFNNNFFPSWEVVTIIGISKSDVTFYFLYYVSLYLTPPLDLGRIVAKALDFVWLYNFNFVLVLEVVIWRKLCNFTTGTTYYLLYSYLFSHILELLWSRSQPNLHMALYFFFGFMQMVAFYIISISRSLCCCLFNVPFLGPNLPYALLSNRPFGHLQKMPIIFVFIFHKKRDYWLFRQPWVSSPQPTITYNITQLESPCELN